MLFRSQPEASAKPRRSESQAESQAISLMSSASAALISFHFFPLHPYFFSTLISFIAGNCETRNCISQLPALYYERIRRRKSSPPFDIFYPGLLYRICLILCICCCYIHTCLLRFSVLEEFCCNLWEQCIRKNILILLLVLRHFLLELSERWL